MGRAAKRVRQCIICKNYCPTIGYRYDSVAKYVFYCPACNKKITVALEPLK